MGVSKSNSGQKSLRKQVEILNLRRKSWGVLRSKYWYLARLRVVQIFEIWAWKFEFWKFVPLGDDIVIFKKFDPCLPGGHGGL